MSVNWNPWHGCRKISEGCLHCYVYRQDAQWGADSSMARRTSSFYLPTRRDRTGRFKVGGGQMVYTCFTSDFLLEEADPWRDECWQMMSLRRDLQFMFFTKRIARLADLLPADWGEGDAASLFGETFPTVRSFGDITPYREGDTVEVDGIRLEVLDTPGHTPGSVTLRAENVLFTGDTLFAGSMGRTDLPGGDEGEIMRSLKRLGELEGQLSEIDNLLADYNRDLAEYMADCEFDDEEYAEVEERLNLLNHLKEKYGNTIEDVIAYGQDRQKLLDKLNDYDAYMRQMEEQGEVSYWAILFSSSSFSELLDNYMMIEEIIQYDNKVMEDLEALQTQVTADRAALEEAQAEQEEAKQKQVAVQQELKEQENEVDKLIGEISAREDQLEEMEAELKKAANDLDAEIKRKEKEYADQIKNVVSESGFLWPLPAGQNTLTSFYGNREDPFTHKSKNHTGIDVSAPRGTPIYAAKSGVVTTSKLGSGSSWAYGEHVVISHSDGTSTLYAHMSARNVTQGQTVKQGAVIGYVGTTGRSTGNHLHFEVRVHGDRRDPLSYFKDKTLYFSGKGGKVKVQ